MNVDETIKLIFEERLPDKPRSYHIKFSNTDIEYVSKEYSRIIGGYIHIPKWLLERMNFDYSKYEVK